MRGPKSCKVCAKVADLPSGHRCDGRSGWRWTNRPICRSSSTSPPPNGSSPLSTRTPFRFLSTPSSPTSSPSSTPTPPHNTTTPSPSSAPSPGRGVHTRPSAQRWPDPACRVRSVQLYSSTDPHTDLGEGTPSVADAVADANSYRPFKLVDAAIARAIARELDLLGEQDEEGARCHPARPTLF